jgi:LCP family protein required for cell wall assembly
VDDATERPERGDHPDDSFPRRRDVHGKGNGSHGKDTGDGSDHPHRWRRWVAIGAAVVLVAVAGVSALAFWRLNQNITKVDVSSDLGTDRPTQAPEATEAVNILLIGSDTREGEGNDAYANTSGQSEPHSDTNLLVHLSADRTWATVVSIPRDSMTPAPPDCSADAPKEQWVDRQWNHNFSMGGTGCLIRTLEGNTGVFIDHYAIVDFVGFKDMVNALGGVEVCTPEAIDDPTTHLVLEPGRHVLDGRVALQYVRARKGLGDGSDIGRIGRQQAFLSSVAQKATSTQLLFQPTKLYGFLDAATKSLTTDPEFSLGTMKDLAESVRGIGLDNIEFITVPNEVYAPDPNRVQWQESADVIWESLREDRRLSEDADPSATPTPTEEPLTVSPDEISVVVANGSGATGLAGQEAEALRVQGFADVTTDNAAYRTGTLVEYPSGMEEAARTVAAAFPGATVEEASEPIGGVIRVTLGAGSESVVEVPNRLGSAPLPSQPITAPDPAPGASPSIEARTADQDICGDD